MNQEYKRYLNHYLSMDNLMNMDGHMQTWFISNKILVPVLFCLEVIDLELTEYGKLWLLVADSNESEAAPESITITGTVDTIRKMTTKDNDVMAVIEVNHMTCVLFPNTWIIFAEYIYKGASVTIDGVWFEAPNGDRQVEVWAVDGKPEAAPDSNEWIYHVLGSNELHLVNRGTGRTLCGKNHTISSWLDYDSAPHCHLCDACTPETVAGETDSAYRLSNYGNIIRLQNNTVIASFRDPVDAENALSVLNTETESLRASIVSKDARIAALESVNKRLWDAVNDATHELLIADDSNGSEFWNAIKKALDKLNDLESADAS